MYQGFFGFSERPFQLTPNPRFLFLNPGYREALATLRYGMASSIGITLLLGEAGTGKTTLLQAALSAERKPEHRYAVLSNPTLTIEDFYRLLANAFELPDPDGSKGQFLLAFEKDILARHDAGGLTAIVIDEAQALSHQLFEEVRLLANFETPTAKLVNLVLVGQKELSDRLNEPSLRQFKQRVALRCSLVPLDLSSTGSYIAARLRVAGAVAADIFTRDAVRTIYEASSGIPRTIGVICENALLAGFAAQKKPVDQAVILDVCRDLDLPVKGPVTLEERKLIAAPVTTVPVPAATAQAPQAAQPTKPAPMAPVKALLAAPSAPKPVAQPAAAEPVAVAEAPKVRARPFWTRERERSQAATLEPQAAGREPQAGEEVDPQPQQPRRRVRAWFSGRRGGAQPAAAQEPDAEQERVPDRSRIFNFFD